MANYRRRAKIRLSSTSSFLHLFCASMLLMLPIISIITVSLLEFNASSHPFGPHISTREATVQQHISGASTYMPREPNELQDKSGTSMHLQDVVTTDSNRNLWVSKYAKYYEGCSSASKSFSRSVSEQDSNGYVLIYTSGGLNQQRTGITNAVVAARILNATLVVPELDHASFWKDSSNFSDIFDVDWFISTLASDVVIVKQLPSGFKFPSGKLRSIRVPRKCPPHYYETKVLPILRKKKLIQLSKFDYRLANKIEDDLQKLRCRVNYHALRFTNNILGMGQALVNRLRQKSNHYIALHLRFEPDMLAFSGCYYGGGENETRELGAIRKRWKRLHLRNPDRERRNGKCPLTPEEVGLMLRALGFGSDSYLYVASGEIYGGEISLAPLKKLFPNYYTKDSLATKEELQPFSAFSSRMAAIDYIVCDESDAFVTNNNGNMARMLAGERRYFGHKRAIRPNLKTLSPLFLRRANMSWSDFSRKVRSVQKGFMGEPDEMRPGRGEFFENPSACICKKPHLKGELEEVLSQRTKTIAHKRVQNNTNQGTENADESEEEDDNDDNDHADETDNDPDKDPLLQRSEESEMEDLSWLSD